jgi:hypothetical protein
MHPEARFTPAEKQELLLGLMFTVWGGYVEFALLTQADELPGSITNIKHLWLCVKE